MLRWFVKAAKALTESCRGQAREVRGSDAGDVPGWVMVTLMSALLVAAIFALAETQLTAILTEALETVLP